MSSTSLETTSVTSQAQSHPDHPDVSLQKRTRRSSGSSSRRNSFCYSMPHTSHYESLSINSAETLASIRLLVLSYLSDLEARISQTEVTWKEKGEMTVEDLRQWSHTAMDMLDHIRDDVRSHLPDLSLPGDVSAVEDFVKARLLPDNMRHRLDDISSKLPDMPHLSDFSLLDFRAKLDEVCDMFHHIGMPRPLTFAPRLSEHLSNLQSHLASIEMPSSPFSVPSILLKDLLDSLMSLEFVQEILAAADNAENPTSEKPPTSDSPAVQAVLVARGVKRSLKGSRLITLADLPQAWRNNPFVRQGYRFIPIENWPLILLSIFMLHNETLNIHTHLVPAVSWGVRSIPFLNSLPDTPEMLFTAFALLCLFTSAIWHTMAGCAHVPSMEFCARLDYIGIGWLISASVGTIVYYGFRCYPSIGNTFLLLCLATGIAGSIFPFMRWFNEYEYRVYKIAFFLSLTFTSLAPLAALSYLHSTKQMFEFIAPVTPSLISYVAGLFFYATHFPECFLPESWARKLDVIGGGSHCIWHCFIVLAVSQHKSAIATLKPGIGVCA